MRRSLLIFAAVFALAGCGVPTFEPAADVPAVASPPAMVAPVDPIPGVPVKVTIPKLGVVDEVVPVGLAQDNAMELPDVSETGWYRLSVRPGEPGPAVLAGHVDWDGQKGALGRIGELRNGDDITVTDVDGAVRTFRVYDVRPELKKIEYQQHTVPLVFGARTTADLELVTCSGPVTNGEYRDNTVVSARLVPST